MAMNEACSLPPHVASMLTVPLSCCPPAASFAASSGVRSPPLGALVAVASAAVGAAVAATVGAVVGAAVGVPAQAANKTSRIDPTANILNLFIVFLL
jgi:hypothetical protein